MDSRWNRLSRSTRAGVLAFLLGIGVFVGVRIDDRHSCVVLASRSTTTAITLGPAPRTPSPSFAVRLARDVEVVGQVWILDRPAGEGWRPTWQLLASINGTTADVRGISDSVTVTDVGFIGPRTIGFRFPDGLRSGTYRLRPYRDAESPALEIEVACRSGLIAEWYGTAALTLRS